MYELIIDKGRKGQEHLTFDTMEDREKYITNNWNNKWDYLVPCVWGGWIDIRDCWLH